MEPIVQPDPGIFPWITENIWLPLLGALGVAGSTIFNMQSGRIKKVEAVAEAAAAKAEAAVSQTQFTEHKTHIREWKEDVQANQDAIWTEIKDMRRELGGKFDDLMKAFYEGERRRNGERP